MQEAFGAAVPYQSRSDGWWKGLVEGCSLGSTEFTINGVVRRGGIAGGVAKRSEIFGVRTVDFELRRG